jgi:Cell division protein CrgA
MANKTPAKSSAKSSGKSRAKKSGGPPPKPSRYTPPTPKSKKTSPLWIPTAMFTCLLLGLLVIVGNYLELLPGGQAQNSSLFIGLGLMVTGFGLSTQYR